jgi:hypothetical protein
VSNSLLHAEMTVNVPFPSLVARIALGISHGYDIRDGNDPVVLLASEANANFSKCMAPGAYLCDVLPIRKSDIWPIREPAAHDLHKSDISLTGLVPSLRRRRKNFGRPWKRSGMGRTMLSRSRW